MVACLFSMNWRPCGFACDRLAGQVCLLRPCAMCAGFSELHSVKKRKGGPILAQADQQRPEHGICAYAIVVFEVPSRRDVLWPGPRLGNKLYPAIGGIGRSRSAAGPSCFLDRAPHVALRALRLRSVAKAQRRPKALAVSTTFFPVP